MGEKENISGYTKTVCLIGSPVSHSKSPAMHCASFAQMGIDAIYVVFDVQPEDLPVIVPALTRLGLIGYNVTMPCKTYVGQYLDELSPAAELMGAVNTVVIKDGKAIGHNTDGAGFMRNLKENGVDIIGKKMAIAGAGGAGSAIFTQAALDGVAEIDILNIKDEFWDAMVARTAELAERTGCTINFCDLNDEDCIKNAVGDAEIFVNATRVGMSPMDDQCVLPEKFLREGLVLADTVYNPRKTKMLAMAEAHGNKTVDGIGMMVWQGAIAEEIWVGKTMDVDYIEKMFFS